MSGKISAALLALLVWFLLAGSALAQTPRPTPTNVAPPGGGGNGDEFDESDRAGTISGYVYEDVNWDGRCVHTDVEGENPIQGIDVQFVSSDRATVITHYSGVNGDFGLYPAGQSYWEITILPPAEWTVTSESTLYVPVYPESLSHDNVNFCLARGANAVIFVPPGAGVGTVLLPESGASAAELAPGENGVMMVVVGVTAVAGLAFLFAGYYLERRRQMYGTLPD